MTDSPSVRSALTAFRAFFTTPPNGAIGALDVPKQERRNLAAKSRAWRCAVCGGTNEELVAAAPMADESDVAEVPPIVDTPVAARPVEMPVPPLDVEPAAGSMPAPVNLPTSTPAPTPALAPTHPTARVGVSLSALWLVCLTLLAAYLLVRKMGRAYEGSLAPLHDSL